MIKAAILTISDTRTKDNDSSAKAIQNILTEDKFNICSYEIVKDDKKAIKDHLNYLIGTLKADLILTTGGTGLGLRDVTPEVTLEVIDKQVPGISEFMRIEGAKKTQRAILSRGVSGLKANTLIVNLPGSPKGVKESLECVLESIIHAVAMVRGEGH